MEFRKLAAAISGKPTLNGFEKALSLKGPFGKNKGETSFGNFSTDVEREVAPIDSPEFLSALNEGLEPGYQISEEEMAGPHVFTVEADIYFHKGRGGSGPDHDEMVLNDFMVTAIDGLTLSEADSKATTEWLDLSSGERDKIVSQYEELASDD